MKTAKPEDWKTESLPMQRTTIALSRIFSAHEIERMRRGVVPEQMEDKWFVYWKDDALFFHRSWTGFCIYIVRFAPKDGGWEMFEADVNRDSEQYRELNDARDAAMIIYLVDVLLLHQDAAFPSSEPSAEKSALINWSQVGRTMFDQHPSDDEIL